MTLKPLPALFSALIAIALLTTGCQDDAEIWEAYSEELCEIRTGADGKAASITTDSGRELQASSLKQPLTPDTLYRAMAVIIENDNGPQLYGIQFLAALPPTPNVAADKDTKAVRLLTCWRTKRYVNLRVGLPSCTESAHVIGFADDGFRYHAPINGKPFRKTKKLRFLYNSNIDQKDFYEEHIISCPVYGFDEELTPEIDSIELTIYTEKGKTIFTTPY